MAGERRGICYEALCAIVLGALSEETLQRIAARYWSVLGRPLPPDEGLWRLSWGARPAALSTAPDLALGPDPERPRIIFLVTHSSAAGNSHMKFWRNLGELAALKGALDPPPEAALVLFDGLVKRSLLDCQALAFDHHLFADELPSGRALRTIISGALSSLGGSREEKRRHLAVQIEAADGGDALADLRSAFTERLTAPPKRRLPIERSTLWRRLPESPPREIKKTALRRGLSKLLLFQGEPALLEALYPERWKMQAAESPHRISGGDRGALDALPQWLFDCGLARRTIAGARAVDPELAEALALSAGERHAVLSAPLAPGLQSLISQIKESEHRSAISHYLAAAREVLQSPEALRERLVALDEDPSALSAEIARAHQRPPEGWPPAHNWLLPALLDLLKLSAGSQSGFGQARLAREAAARCEDNTLKRALLSPWGYLSRWISRAPDSTLPRPLIGALAAALAAHLQEISAPRWETLCAALPATQLRRLYQNQLVSHRGFDPLLALLRYHLPEGELLTIGAGLAAAAGLPAGRASSRVYHVGSCWIYWQAAYGSHCRDKRRELVGRLLALQRQWDAARRRFIDREGVDRFFLFLDGDWGLEDRAALRAQGWGPIFSAHEGADLAQACRRSATSPLHGRV